MNDKVKPNDKTISEAELKRKNDVGIGDFGERSRGHWVSDTTAPPPNPHRGDKDKGKE